MKEEDMPENYGDLAKRVYAMSEKEGWTKEKTFELLKSPQKLIAHMENVRQPLPFLHILTYPCILYIEKSPRLYQGI
jgi:hypothetical protein